MVGGDHAPGFWGVGGGVVRGDPEGRGEGLEADLLARGGGLALLEPGSGLGAEFFEVRGVLLVLEGVFSLEHGRGEGVGLECLFGVVEWEVREADLVGEYEGEDVVLSGEVLKPLV